MNCIGAILTVGNVPERAAAMLWASDAVYPIEARGWLIRR